MFKIRTRSKGRYNLTQSSVDSKWKFMVVVGTEAVGFLRNISSASKQLRRIWKTSGKNQACSEWVSKRWSKMFKKAQFCVQLILNCGSTQLVLCCFQFLRLYILSTITIAPHSEKSHDFWFMNVHQEILGSKSHNTTGVFLRYLFQIFLNPLYVDA